MRNRHAIPSTVDRISSGGRPLPFGVGNNGSNFAHISSEISCLIAMDQGWLRTASKSFSNTP